MTIQLLNLGLRAVTLAVKFAFILALAVFLPPEEVGLYGLITVTVSYSIYFVGFEFYTFSTRDLVARPRSEWSRLLSNQLVFFGLMYVVVLPAFSIVFFSGNAALERDGSVYCLGRSGAPVYRINAIACGHRKAITRNASHIHQTGSVGPVLCNNDVAGSGIQEHIGLVALLDRGFSSKYPNWYRAATET